MIVIFYIKELYNENEIFNENYSDYSNENSNSNSNETISANFNAVFRLPTFLKKLVIKFFKIANIIAVKENIIILPYYASELNKLSNKKITKILKKINKTVCSENGQSIFKNIAISNAINNLENIDTIKNYFYSNNYNILDGRWLFKHLSYEIVEFISKETEKPLNEMEVSVLTNANSSFIKENIRLLAQNIKNLNIVTSNIDFFKPLAQELYNSFGISIRISNNKKKILTNSDVIFNFDFPDVILNKFALPLKCVLINYNGKIKLRNKLFNGLNVSYYTINVNKNIIENFRSVNLLNSFSLEILYESLYFKEQSYSKMLSHFIEDSLVITSLQGNNGKISKNEYKTLDKFELLL